MKRVVTIAGGTGGYPLLRGLAAHPLDITAVFSPFDTGGSSGQLRLEFEGPSWGDIRRGLQALAARKPPYSTIAHLSEFRFPDRSRLESHNLGNLLLVSLAKTEGSPEKGLKAAERLFGLPTGRHVIPSTFDSSDIIVELVDGRRIVGGRQIGFDIGESRIKRVSLNPEVSACESALHALMNADVVVIGPGSIYNSVIPNLLVRGIQAEIRRSRALTVFVCNTVTEARQTDSFKASDFVRVISDCLGTVPRFSLFSNRVLRGKKRVQSHRAFVEVDREEILRTGTTPIVEDLVDEEYVDRHDPRKLARAILRVIDVM